MTTLPLSEVFGPTWQGEGPHTGRRCGFVRLGLCNLSCEWCDTPYTWDSTRFDVAAECPDTPAMEIADRVEAMDVDLMILTGGEPLLHAKRTEFCPLGALLLGTSAEWHVETNGTITPPNWLVNRVSHFTVSPKVGTRDLASKRLRAKPLTHLNYLGATFKFVCRDELDLALTEQVVSDFDLDRRRVWIMPEGTTAQELLECQRRLAGPVLDSGFNYGTRLHVLLHDDKRGV